MEFGAKLRELRNARGMSLAALAAVIPYDKGTLSKIENGDRRPSEKLAWSLDRFLEQRGELAALRLGAGSEMPAADGAGGEDESEVQRRRFLADLAALGVAASSPGLDALRVMQGGLEDLVGPRGAAAVEDWQEVVVEYGHSYPDIHPAELYRMLVRDLLEVHRDMEGVGEGDPLYPQWCRVLAGLETLLAKTLSNVGERRAAQRWWKTAKRAAARSGDRDVELWIGGERLIHGLYERRPVTLLLREADALLTCAPSSGGGAGLAKTLAARGQLLAAQGDPAALDVLDAYRNVFDELPDSDTADIHSIWNTGPDRRGYFEAYVLAYLGQHQEAAVAVRQVEELMPTGWRMSGQLRLLGALSQVRGGDVLEGVDHAHEVYSGFPPGQRAMMMSRLAGEVLASVPDDARTSRPVSAYRELVGSAGPRSIT
ncbi:helix-turn-helix transcriptional regulator [Actinomadura macrotermitis]|uniref:HTH cro/C1-type domain-containing protein n=1 Tax=Actinomadura macrotermitis TaxID=2585200 RepID=A0A7K0BQY1_9ACTN|nr:helix-turn-helix transcriptional regulator [Actinomadura macrotermitis]MQY03585.1 hypothetical protein [Actinomadura macrotermitis]